MVTNRNQRPQERNEQRNQGSDRRNNRPDQRRGGTTPVTGAKLISKRAAALKAEQNAEYARGSEDRYKQQAAKAEQERQQRRKRVEAPEVNHRYKSQLLRTADKTSCCCSSSSRYTSEETSATR